MSNWYDINRCPIWKTLGVIECQNCSTVDQCWGDEIYCVTDCEFCPYPCSHRDEDKPNVKLRTLANCLGVKLMEGK